MPVFHLCCIFYLLYGEINEDEDDDDVDDGKLFNGVHQ